MNLARTTPELPVEGVSTCTTKTVVVESVRREDVPWGRVTLPQITRILEPRTSRDAR